MKIELLLYQHKASIYLYKPKSTIDFVLFSHGFHTSVQQEKKMVEQLQTT